MYFNKQNSIKIKIKIKVKTHTVGLTVIMNCELWIYWSHYNKSD